MTSTSSWLTGQVAAVSCTSGSAQARATSVGVREPASKWVGGVGLDAGGDLGAWVVDRLPPTNGRPFPGRPILDRSVASQPAGVELPASSRRELRLDLTRSSASSRRTHGAADASQSQGLAAWTRSTTVVHRHPPDGRAYQLHTATPEALPIRRSKGPLTCTITCSGGRI